MEKKKKKSPVMASFKTSPKVIVQTYFKVFPSSLKNFEPFSMKETLSLLMGKSDILDAQAMEFSS